MDELIKIASNGQWSLEKAMTDAETKKAIERFLANRKQSAGTKVETARGGGVWVKDNNSKETAKPSYPAGMQPAQVSTMEHKGEPHAGQSRNEIEAIRAKIDNKEEANAPVVVERKNITAEQLIPQTPATPKNAKVVAANVKPGPSVEKKPSLGSAKPTVEQMPPMEMIRDEKAGQSSMQPRQGRFHGEGATTRGKIVNKQIGYKNQQTGQYGGKMIQQLEQHHWAWDHNNKKWNHVRTSHTNAGEGTGGNHQGVSVETSRPTASQLINKPPTEE